MLVWGQIQWHKLLLDQSLSQSSREAVHVLGHPALVRHTQCWSPRLLRVSWPRPPVVWWSSVSACLDAHVGPMNLQMNSDIFSFSDLRLDSFAVFYSDEIHLVNLLNFCIAGNLTVYHGSTLNNSPRPHVVSDVTQSFIPLISTRLFSLFRITFSSNLLKTHSCSLLLMQRSPSSVLEGRCPAEFSSSPI